MGYEKYWPNISNNFKFASLGTGFLISHKIFQFKSEVASVTLAKMNF